MTTKRPMLTVKKVAKRLRVSKASVYRLIGSGRLLAYRIGVGRGTIRVSDEALNAYLTASEVTADSKPSKQTRTPLRHIQW